MNPLKTFKTCLVTKCVVLVHSQNSRNVNCRMQLKKKTTKFSSLVETVEADHTSEDKERGVERC